MHAAGSIPSAINVPAPQMVSEDGTVKTREELRELFTSKGVDLSKPVAIHCQVGVMATFGFSAAEKAGLTGEAKMYDGSYSEF